MTELSGIEESRAMSIAYTSKFEQCPAISLSEIEKLRGEGHVYLILIDVRTEEERAVSIVEGALSQRQFEALKLDPEADDCAKHILVTYCTIGFRSGLYGKELAKKGWGDRVRNGEGIVVFSYDSKLKLVDPSTGEDTNRIHCFGSDWDKAHPSKEAVVFGVWGQAKTIPATMAAMCTIS